MKVRLVAAQVGPTIGFFAASPRPSEQMRIDMRKLMMAALLALPMFGATAMAQDTLKIGYRPVVGWRCQRWRKRLEALVLQSKLATRSELVVVLRRKFAVASVAMGRQLENSPQQRALHHCK
jgi:hypothetical protein